MYWEKPEKVIHGKTFLIMDMSVYGSLSSLPRFYCLLKRRWGRLKTCLHALVSVCEKANQRTHVRIRKSRIQFNNRYWMEKKQNKIFALLVLFDYLVFDIWTFFIKKILLNNCTTKTHQLVIVYTYLFVCCLATFNLEWIWIKFYMF